MLPAPPAVAAAVVCHAHPLHGGSMHLKVVLRAARALQQNGVAALRFNFRGVGRSPGRFADGVGEREDAVAGLAYLRQREGVDAAKVGLVGYSFGAAVALVAADERVAALVAISPPPFGHVIAPSAIRCPALLMTGDRDDVAPPGHVRLLARTIGPQCQVEVVPGADHFWSGYDEKLAQTVARFLRDSLAAGR